MKRIVFLALLQVCIFAAVPAQSPSPSPDAANTVQVSSVERATAPQTGIREVRIPAGTPVEIEVAYTINSQYVSPEELITFHVVVPMKADGVTLVDKGSLVTGRVVQAKRAGHWGKAGKLSWIMQDVVAVDLTRVPLTARANIPIGEERVIGQSHAGEVATKTIVMGALLAPAFPIAPLALMQGFKRGENAIVPEGKRFVVYVKTDTVIRVNSVTPGP